MKILNVIGSFMLAAGLAACGGGGGCSSSEACSDGVVTGATDQAVSVAIGSGDKIETTAKDIKYAFRYAITVSDNIGRPVVGAIVSPRIQMLGFYKGKFFRDTDYKVTGVGVVDSPNSTIKVGPSQFCPNEDVNNNFIKDTDEDLNGDGVLTPEGAAVVATVEGSNKTDDQGIVYFRIEYAKTDANWLLYKLTASAVVTGTEGSVTQEQRTGYAIGDEATQSTPFIASRFGVTPGCDNAL